MSTTNVGMAFKIWNQRGGSAAIIRFVFYGRFFGDFFDFFNIDIDAIFGLGGIQMGDGGVFELFHGSFAGFGEEFFADFFELIDFDVGGWEVSIVGSGGSGGGGWLDFFVGGDAVDLNDEHHRADLHVIAGIDDGFLDADAVVERSVGAAQVFDLQDIVVGDEAAMFSRDIAKRNAQVAIFTTANDGHGARQRKAAPLAIGPKHHQNHLHVALPLDAKLPQVYVRAHAAPNATLLEYRTFGAAAMKE